MPKDEVEAYKWWLLAATQGDEDAKKSIPELESKLSREQIADARERARKFKPTTMSSAGGQLPARIRKSGEVKVSYISLPWRGTAERAAVRREARLLRNNLLQEAKGTVATGFQNKATRTDIYEKGQLMKALDEAAYRQAVGVVGPVIETESGCFILLVMERDSE